jgi:hypothetical protein
MKTILGAVMTLALSLPFGMAPAFGGGKDPAPAVPQYNVKSETFIKLMAMPIRNGLKDVGITGSKVKFEGTDLVLARELRIEKTVLSIRDETGFPNWLWATRTGIATGGF